VARRRSRALFDLCAGFVYSQVLLATIELGVLDALAEAPMGTVALAKRAGLADAAMERLLAAAQSLRLVRRWGAVWRLGSLGAAAVGNGAVQAMVRHHALLYADLADPVAALRAPPGGGRLARYWAYAGRQSPATLRAEDVADYSALMAESQPLVAAEVLRAYDLRRHRCLMDVGGGEGAFLRAAAEAAPGLQQMLFDLPAVAERARARLPGGVAVHGGDMLREDWPRGADVISLVRVVHDHDDEAAGTILRRARAALPEGGTLLLGEPMAEAPGAGPVGAAYFGFYLFAMGSGRARSAPELCGMLRAAGFRAARPRPTDNPLITGLIVAQA
jgi:demethylspheroidene O-methyltransferase